MSQACYIQDTQSPIFSAAGNNTTFIIKLLKLLIYLITKCTISVYLVTVEHLPGRSPFLSHFITYLLKQKAAVTYYSIFPFNSGQCNVNEHAIQSKKNFSTANCMQHPSHCPQPKTMPRNLEMGRRCYLMLRKYAFKHRRQTCSTPHQLHVDRYS